MKSIAMLVAAAAAVLAVNTSGAHSQDACSKTYVACMDICVARPSQGLQDSCIASCQAKNNQCSEKIYGSRQETNPTRQPPVEGNKALAKEAAPPPRKVDIDTRKQEGAGTRKAERPTLRKVEVPPRRKVEAPAEAQDRAAPSAENRAVGQEPVEAQK